MIDIIKIFDYAKEELFWDIKGYEGLYQVSHTGKVRSLNYYGTKRVQDLKNTLMNNGYFCVNLFKNEKSKIKLVHRLVAEAFIPNLENKTEIDHLDTNKQNNHVNNLRYCTHKENCNNEITKVNKCLSNLGNKNPKAKKYYLYDNNKKLILKLVTRGQLAFFLSKYSNYKMGTIETTFLYKNNKYSIVNTGKLFADKFYIYDYQINKGSEING